MPGHGEAAQPRREGAARGREAALGSLGQQSAGFAVSWPCFAWEHPSGLPFWSLRSIPGSACSMQPGRRGCRGKKCVCTCVYVCRYVGGVGAHRVHGHVCVCRFMCSVHMYVCTCVCVHMCVCVCVYVLLISHDHGLETWLLKGGLTTLPTTLSSPILVSLSCCAGSFIPDQPAQPLMRPWGHGWWAE